MSYFAGLDWAANEHAVCVIDDKGSVVLRLVVKHTEEGLTGAVAKLRRFTEEAPLRIAIERPTGLVVDTLVDAGFHVVPIHPNVVKATRPRYSSVGAKSDPGDSYLLADLLRTDGHRFKTLTPLGDETKALRALVRARGDLVAERVALANQLRALVESFWAGAACIFRDIDSPIALAFLGRYPTPQHAERVGEKRLEAFLARNHYSGRRDVAELLGRLRGAPSGMTAAWASWDDGPPGRSRPGTGARALGSRAGHAPAQGARGPRAPVTRGQMQGQARGHHVHPARRDPASERSSITW